jgi:Nif-specific regulatory protein
VAETGTLKLEDWQRILVIEALRRTGGSVPNAAAELGISRATLYRKLELYGLTRES